MRHLARYYGDLAHDPEARVRFMQDARGLLTDVGEALAREGLVGETWKVKRVQGRGSYAGEIYGLYPAKGGRHGVLVALVHEQGERLTRLDGVAGFVQRRRLRDAKRFEIRSSDLEREPLRSFSPWGVLDQVRAMLKEGVVPPVKKRRKKAAAKKAPAKKSAAKKAAAKKVAKKRVVKKTATKKVVRKKAVSKKTVKR